MVGILGMILFAATQFGLVYLVQTFLKGAFVTKDPRIEWMVPLGVVGLFALRGLGDYVGNYYPSWVGRQVIKGLRHDVFAHYLRLPTAYLDSEQSGVLLSKLTYNIEQVAGAATGAAISLDQRHTHIAGLIAYLFYLNWRLALSAWSPPRRSAGSCRSPIGASAATASASRIPWATLRALRRKPSTLIG